MITNPSCQSEQGGKEEQTKFQAPSFEEDLPDIGVTSNGPLGGNTGSQGGGLTDLSAYSHSYSHGGGHGTHYGSHYTHYGGGVWQGSADYSGYYQGGQAGGYYPAHYQGPGGGGGYHQDWTGQTSHMVLPPGPSPTGSNNSPSPLGFSDTNEEISGGHHVVSRTELKRPSPDSYLHSHNSLGQQSSLHQQQPVPKKPKVSKRRKKRDPNEPQKPVSAYALFFRDTQASIKMRNPNANFGEVSKIVAATWDGLDPDNKAAYKRRTELAKKEYLRALAAYRANMVSKGSGHELYGGFPGYGSMLLSGQSMEQAMPATGLGPNSGSGGMGGHTMAGQGIPTQYNGAGYHPSYIQQGLQLQQHHPQQHSPGHDNHSPKLELKEEASSYETYSRSQSYPAQSYPGGPPTHHQPSYSPHSPPTTQTQQHYTGQVNRNSGKCGRPGCPQFVPNHAEFCSSECVVGECKDVFTTWPSCMVKPSQGGATSDVMVK